MARLSLVPPLAGLAADAQRLGAEAAEAISVARLASRAQRLVGGYGSFAHFGESRDFHLSVVYPAIFALWKRRETLAAPAALPAAEEPAA